MAGVGQVRPPARAAGTEDAVLVDRDDGADRRSLASLQLGKGVVEIGWAEALLREQGPGLGAVGRMEPIARLLQQADNVPAPRSAGDRRRAGDPVDRAAALGAGLQ